MTKIIDEPYLLSKGFAPVLKGSWSQDPHDYARFIPNTKHCQLNLCTSSTGYFFLEFRNEAGDIVALQSPIDHQKQLEDLWLIITGETL
jgi:hypothetical protein